MRKRGLIITLCLMLLLPLALLGSGAQAAQNPKSCSKCGSSVRLEYPQTMEGYTYKICTNTRCGFRDVYCSSHNWVQGDVSKTTCTEDGYFVIKCSYCEASFKQTPDYLKATGHNWGAWQVQNPVTCLVDGSDIRWCEECHIYETRTVKATGHKWTSWETHKPANCQEEGSEIRWCLNCSNNEIRETKKLPHTWGDWTLTKPVTCTQEGVETSYCIYCQQSGIVTGDAVRTRSVPPNGHTWKDWEVTKEPFLDQPGEETRRCQFCDASETRFTEAGAPLAKVGDSSLDVLVAQQILKEMNYYDGPVDGVFGDALTQALKKYAQAKGEAAKKELEAFPAGSEEQFAYKTYAHELRTMEGISASENGALYKNTMEYLSWHYLGELDPQHVPDPMAPLISFPDSKLYVYPMMEEDYKHEENGFHQVQSKITGLHYARYTESLNYGLPRGEGFVTYYGVENYTESCQAGAGNLCVRCGEKIEYKLKFSLSNLKELLGGIIGKGFVLRLGNTSLEDLGLPYVEKLEYQEIDRMLHWDSFPEAAGYRVWIYNLDQDEDKPVETCELVTSCCHPVSETYAGHYAAMVQALGASGEAISNPTVRYYDITENLMPMPENLTLKNAWLSWEYPYEDLNPFYQISIYQDIAGSEEPRLLHSDCTTRRSLSLVDLYVRLAAKGVEPGSSIRAEICVQDGDGSRIASYVAECSEPWVTPDFYRTLALVNVRSGPGKDFSRIGSYRAGSYVMSYGTEMGADGLWVIISYRGETGYIKASSLTWFAPRIFHVNVDAGKDHTGKQVTVSVSTNPDGTISREDLENKVSKYGYVLESLSWKSGSGSGKLDMNTPLSPGDSFTVNWEKDPEYVFVKFQDENRRPVEVLNYFVTPQVYASEIPIRLYSTFSIRTKGDTCPGWYYVTYNEKVDVYDDTLYTSNKDTIIMYERTEQQITLGKQTLLKEGYDSYLSYLFTSRNTSSFTPAQMWEYVRTVEGKHAFRLQAGDVITLKGIYGEQGANDLGTRYYKVYHERLKKEGYIFAALLDKQLRISHSVTFDPGKGRCNVWAVAASIWPGSPYAYPTLKNLPTPTYGGHLFMGWYDNAGRLVTPEYEFTKDTVLKAQYVERSISELSSALIIPAGGSKKELKDQIKPYGYATFDSPEKISLVVGEEVLLISIEYNYDKKTELYQCMRWDHSIIWLEPRFVRMDYTKLVLPEGRAKEVGLMVDPEKDTHYKKYSGYKSILVYYDFFGGVESVKLPGQSREEYVLYILGGNDKGFYEVVVPNIRGEKGKSLGGGRAFTDSYLYGSDIKDKFGTAVVRFSAEKGICAVDKVEVPVGGTLAGKWPQAELSGYEFVGWFTDPVLGVMVNIGDPITKNMTLYAHYYHKNENINKYKTALRKIYIYEQSRERGARVGSIKKGETFAVDYTLIQGNTSYYRVSRPDGVRGYVAGASTTTQGGTRMYYLGAPGRGVDTYIRSQPKAGKGKTYRIPQFWEAFLVIGTEGNYYKIAYPGSEDGYAYINNQLLRPKY